MQTRTKVLIGIVVVAVFASAAALSVVKSRDKGVDVRMEEVARRDLVEIVTASGNIRARKAVDLSSDVSAKVGELLVDEGDDVTPGRGAHAAGSGPVPGRRLPRRGRALPGEGHAGPAGGQHDPRPARPGPPPGAAPAGLPPGEHAADRRRAHGRGGRRRSAPLGPLRRVPGAGLAGRGPGPALQDDHPVAHGREGHAPQRGRGRDGHHRNDEQPGQPHHHDLRPVGHRGRWCRWTRPTCPRSLWATGHGAHRRLPGPDVHGQGHRDRQLGHPAAPRQQTSGQQAAIDFEVVITLDPTDVDLRPDLSATADIVTETRKDALSVPIIALTVRETERQHPGRLGDGRHRKRPRKRRRRARGRGGRVHRA